MAKSKHELTGIDRIPDELLVNAMVFLNLKELSQLSKVNKRFALLTKSPLLWQQKFKQQFPYLFEGLSNKTEAVDWYQEFLKTFEKEYAPYAPDTEKGKKLIRLITWLKENKSQDPKKKEEPPVCLKSLWDLANVGISYLPSRFWAKSNLKTNLFHDIRYREIFATDKSNYNLLFWAKESGHQDLLDKFYQIIKKRELLAIDRHKDPDGLSHFHQFHAHLWTNFIKTAVECNQPSSEIFYLLDQAKKSMNDSFFKQIIQSIFSYTLRSGRTELCEEFLAYPELKIDASYSQNFAS